MIEDLCDSGHLRSGFQAPRSHFHSISVTQDGDNAIICYTYPEKRLKE